MSNDNKKMKGKKQKSGSSGGESLWQLKKQGGLEPQAIPDCVAEGIPECPPPGSVSSASL